MIKEELEKRALPGLWEQPGCTLEEWEKRRDAIQTMLTEECYGTEYPFPCTVTAEEASCNTNALGGKAVERQIILTLHGEDGKSARFPITTLIPAGKENIPVFLWIRFTEKLENGYNPTEEILDMGYGIVSCYYQDIVPDAQEEKRENDLFETTEQCTWGTIAKWSYGLKRIMDYLETVPFVDAKRVALVGMSRLGKTVLWTAACDERFSLCAAVMSGTGGVSLYRQNEKETLRQVAGNFPYWFCENFGRHAGLAENAPDAGLYFAEKERPDAHDPAESLPFDAHYLAALCAPRFLYACTGTKDEYADYRNEFLACCAASEAYRLYDVEGLSVRSEWPEPMKPLHEGHIGYHIHGGTHFMGRYDWMQIVRFRERHGI